MTVRMRFWFTVLDAARLLHLPWRWHLRIYDRIGRRMNAEHIEERSDV